MYRLGIPVSIVAICLAVHCVSGCGSDQASDESEAVVLASDQLPVEVDAGDDTDGTDTGGSTNGGADSGTGEPGVFKGRIVLQGSFPSLSNLVNQGDPSVQDAVCRAVDVPNESMIVNNQGVANVFIYLAKKPRGAPDVAAEETVQFDQQGCKFIPHAMVLQSGQPMKMINSDNTAHNVNLVPRRNRKFNKLIAPLDRDGLEFSYAKPENEPVEVKCDIHSWMRGYHLPLDHPYGTVTDAEGNFEIPNLPPGKYQFRIWHERAKFLDRAFSVTITDGAVTDVGDVSYSSSSFANIDRTPLKTVVLTAKR